MIKMELGSAFQFMAFIASLIVGAVIYVVLSPLFQTLSEVAVSLFTDEVLYPDDVVTACLYIFKFISYSGIVFFLFLSIQFLKGFLQPWTSEYRGDKNEKNRLFRC